MPSVIVLVALFALVATSCGLALDNQAKLERGQQAFDKGEYRAAIIDARAVLLDEPGNAKARLLLGQASVFIGDGVTAEKEFRHALELGIDKSALIVDLGRSLIQQREFDKVLAEILINVANEDDRKVVMRMRGEALVGLQRPVEAREIYLDVLEIDSSDLGALLGIVNTYIAERNWVQARETLNHVLATDDSYIPALLLSGSLNLQMRKLTAAAADYRRAAELANVNADDRSEMHALSGLAEAELVEENPDEVRQILDRMREIAPEDLRTMMVTARLAIADGDWTAAQENLQRILRRAPEFRGAQMLLGVVHKESGNLGQAEMYLSAVVAASPDNSRARRLLAETRLALNKAEAARQALEPITSEPDADIVSLSMAAGAYLRLGEAHESVELLERAIASDPDNVDLKLQIATAYFRDGQADKAQRVLESLPDMSGQRNEFQSNVLRVLTQMAQGNRTGALNNAKSVRENWPGRSEAHVLVGSIEMAVGDLEAARDSFEQGLNISPDNIPILRYLAQLEFAEDSPQAAKDRILVILEHAPGDVPAMLSLARLAARSEKHDEARDWLEKAREADSNSFSARTMLATLYLAFGEYDAAEDVANEAVNLEPGSAKAQNFLGLAQHYSKNYREAVFSLGRAVELDPDEPSFRLNLARAQAALGNRASAIVTLEDSMDQTLLHLPSGVMLSLLKSDLGDMDGAQEISTRLREQHPQDAAPYALEGELLAQEGDLLASASAFDKALDIETDERYAVRAHQIRNQAGAANQVESLKKFLEVRPLDTEMRVYLAQAYENIGQIGNANTQYQRVLAQEPDNFVAANNLAWSYFTIGDARAEEYARRAYELRPESSAVVDTLGWILVQKGDFDNGIPLLRAAVELSDNGADIQYHLASALAESGEKAEARAILEDLLKSSEPFANKNSAIILLADL